MDPSLSCSNIFTNHPKHPSLLYIKKNNVKERRKNFENIFTNDESRRSQTTKPQLPPTKPVLEKILSLEESNFPSIKTKWQNRSNSEASSPFINNSNNYLNSYLKSDISPNNFSNKSQSTNANQNNFSKAISSSVLQSPLFNKEVGDNDGKSIETISTTFSAYKYLDRSPKNNKESRPSDFNNNRLIIDKTSFSCFKPSLNGSDEQINKLIEKDSLISCLREEFLKNIDLREQNQAKKNAFIIRKKKMNDTFLKNNLVSSSNMEISRPSIIQPNYPESNKYTPPPLPPKPPRLLSYLTSENTNSPPTNAPTEDIYYYERLQDAVSKYSPEIEDLISPENSGKPSLPPRLTPRDMYRDAIPEMSYSRSHLFRAPSVPENISLELASLNEDRLSSFHTPSVFSTNSDRSSRWNRSDFGSSVSLCNSEGRRVELLSPTLYTPINESGYAIPYQNEDVYRQVLKKVERAYSILRRSTEFLNEKEDFGGSALVLNADGFDNDEQYYSEHNKKLRHLNNVKERTYVNVSKYEEIKLRLNVSLYEYALIVGLQKTTDNDEQAYKPIVLLSHPANLSEKDLLACTFCFPDCDIMKPITTFTKEVFSFVLTDSNGDRKFGYCQRYLPPGDGPRSIEAICIVSPIGETALYEQLLDAVRKCRSFNLDRAKELLRVAYLKRFPRPNMDVKLVFASEEESPLFTLKRHQESYLSNVKFGVLMTCLPINLIIQIFSSVLLERRIIFLADRLSTLSSCINSILMLLYPFSWQHTLVMTLPLTLYEIIESPTPYIVGILSKSQALLLSEYELEEVLIVDLNNRCFLRKMNDEHRILPRKLQKALTSALMDVKAEQPGFPRLTDVAVKEAFLRLFLETCGHYSACISKSLASENIFDRNQFLEMVSSESIRMFLDWFSSTQMFQVFISERLTENHRSRSFERRIDKYQFEMKKMASNGEEGFGKKFIQKFKNYGVKFKKNLLKHSYV